MMLPYTTDVFFAAMARYNADHAGLVALLAGLSTAVFALAVFGTRKAWQDRAVGAVLAAGALMSGWAHQSGLMADLNFMASVYGPLWIVQGGLLAGTLALRPRLSFAGADTGSSADGRTRLGGLAIAALGLIGHPLALLAHGVDAAGLPLAGSAPDATAILIAGLLAAARGPRWLRLGLLLLPLAWGGVAATSAYLLGFAPDALVPLAVLGAAGLTVADRRCS
jgi:hypothetical protein